MVKDKSKKTMKLSDVSRLPNITLQKLYWGSTTKQARHNFTTAMIIKTRRKSNKSRSMFDYKNKNIRVNTKDLK